MQAGHLFKVTDETQFTKVVQTIQVSEAFDRLRVREAQSCPTIGHIRHKTDKKQCMRRFA